MMSNEEDETVVEVEEGDEDMIDDVPGEEEEGTGPYFVYMLRADPPAQRWVELR